MIIKSDEIYKRVSAKYQLDVELVESVGESVLTDLIERLNSPTELCYELPKLGMWRFRFKEFRRNLLWMLPETKEQHSHMIPLMEQFLTEKARKRKIRRTYVTKQRRKAASQNKSDQHQEISES